MRSIIRLLAAGAVALPVLVGAAGIASADAEYEDSTVAATPFGAGIHTVESGADEDGVAYFYESFLGAGPMGAGFEQTGSLSYPGGAAYGHEFGFVGPFGAVAGDTESSADTNDWDDEDWDDEGDDEDWGGEGEDD